MNARIKNMTNGTKLKGRPFTLLCTIMFMTYNVSSMGFSIPTVLYEAFGVLKTRRSTHRARCLLPQVWSSANTENKEEEAINNSDNKKKQYKEKISPSPAIEIKMILLGATGSGKSSAGNILLQKYTKDQWFKTSCFAKSETKVSTIINAEELMTTVKIQKKFKVGIIDTPANRDSGLDDKNIENEMKLAKELSSPGEVVYLLCIPATAITKYFTKDVDYYNKLFTEFDDSTIVVFTRCDQFEKENNKKFDGDNAMENYKNLKKFKRHITLSKTLSEKEKEATIEKLIEHIDLICKTKTS